MVDEEFNAGLEDSAPHELNGDAGRPRVRKAADAFRTISEVADELHVPQHVLRFWETKFPQVRPLKRGGGRRYYRPEDVALLRRVADLLYTQGYTIKGVQRLLRDGGITAPEPAQDHAPPPSQPSLLPPEPAFPVREAAPQAEPDPEPTEPESLAVTAPEPVADPAPLPDPPRAMPPAMPMDDKETARLRVLLVETLASLEALRRALG